MGLLKPCLIISFSQSETETNDSSLVSGLSSEPPGNRVYLIPSGQETIQYILNQAVCAVVS